MFASAPWWWWKAQQTPFAYGATTMLALGLLLNFAGIGLFCWLIFTLAVYALPFFVALNVFMMVLHGGAGIFGAPLVAIAAGGMTLAIGQTAFSMTRSVITRAIIAALFAVPAALAGYQFVFAMSQIGVPSLVWRERDLRLSRRGLCWRHGVDAVDRLHRDPPARFGQGSPERSSTGSHSRHA
jgi:hypothetical protein